MTTLFPQIKRVDEDETSKIIKNVLFNDQDDVKLEQIFDEFMHLTEESLTYSDDDDDDEEEEMNGKIGVSRKRKESEVDDEDDDDEDDDDDDDEDDESDDDEDDDSDDDDSEDEDDDDEGDEDDEDDDEDDDDEDEDDDDEDGAEEEEKDKPKPLVQVPMSWNLDQFIPNAKPQPGTQAKQPTPPTSTETSTKYSSHKDTSKSRETIKVEPQPSPPELPPVKTPPAPETKRQPTPDLKRQPTPETKRQLAPETKRQPASDTKRQSAPEPKRQPEPVPPITKKLPLSSSSASSSSSSSSSSLSTSSSSSNSTTASHHPSSSFMVQIDLSKLKRIPITKAQTPTTISSKSLLTAKALKHEADAEKDKTKQAIKYLEACMYFVLHGHEIESTTKNPTYYVDTIPLFKHALRISAPSLENRDNMTNLKTHTLILRCLSLLHMKLYKLRERELHDNQKIINSQQNSSPIQQADGLLLGVRPQLLSAYKRQLSIYHSLRCAHDQWQQADQFCDQHPAVRIFFSTIESNCGPLTFTSQLPKLMDHVKCGLKLLRS